MNVNDESPSRILIIDDSPDTIRLLAETLKDLGQVLFATSGDRGITLARQRRPHLILLDVTMSDVDGYEVCRRLKADPRTRDCAVIFVTAMRNPECEVQAMSAGGVDFLPKPLNPPVVRARVQTHLKLLHQSAMLVKLAEDKIRFQASLLDSVGQSVIATDLNGTITYWNPQAEKLYGWTASEVMGRDILDVLPKDAKLGQEIFDCVLEGKCWSGELLLRQRNGRPVEVHLTVTPIYNEHGHMIGRVGVSFDISARKTTESRLHESEERFKSISSNIPGMTFQLRLAGNFVGFTYVSEGSLEVCGLPPDHISASFCQFVDLLEASDCESFLQSMQYSAQNLAVWNWEGRFKQEYMEQIKWINLRATPRCVENQSVIWDGVIFNISDSKRYEASLLTNRKMLQDLSAHQVLVKEEERKRIAREIHDELGQRLTVLRMDVLMLPRLTGDQSALPKEMLTGMRESIDEIIRIVRNIASDLRPAVLDFGIVTAIEWLLEQFQASLKIPCRLHNMVERTINLSDEQATGLFRILQESMTNIARHAHATRIEVMLKLAEDRLFIEIEDDGVGFDPSRALLTKSYGLVGMRERATMLGGEIEIFGRPGQGTIVRARIPLMTPQQLAA